MLTSSNQYLRPEYLSPLPTTLDAKKSPLALLAQTCSAIGSDSPNPKLISAAEKASLKSSHKYSTSESSNDKSSPVNAPNAAEPKASFKPYESCLTSREKTRTPEDRTSRVKSPISSKGSASNTPVQQPRCGSNQSSSSHRTSPSNRIKSPSQKSSGRTSPPQDSPIALKINSESRENLNGSRLSPTNSKHPYPPTSTTASDVIARDALLNSLKHSQNVPVSSAAFLSGLPSSGFPLPMDLMTSSLMAAQHHALKNGINPYLAYARMKAPGGNDLPICRDPYCSGCSLSSHMINGMKSGPGPCPAGCLQCDHAKTPFHLPAGHPAAAAAYAHAQIAALAAASQLPYVCNWMAGDTAYCGKRFANSDELLQHLRTHTSAAGDTTPSLSMLGSSGLPPNHPLLQRSYPTPPLSPLMPRFHPYSKPSHLLSSPSLPFSLPHPSLAAYFPPYSMFGPRGLHP